VDSKYEYLLFSCSSCYLAIISASWYVSAENRKAFFENYARDHGFDPGNPENWYSQPYKKIISVKVK
jgi:hypothetical protein